MEKRSYSGIPPERERERERDFTTTTNNWELLVKKVVVIVIKIINKKGGITPVVGVVVTVLIFGNFGFCKIIGF